MAWTQPAFVLLVAFAAPPAFAANTEEAFFTTAPDGAGGLYVDAVAPSQEVIVGRVLAHDKSTLVIEAESRGRIVDESFVVSNPAEMATLTVGERVLVYREPLGTFAVAAG